LSEKTTIAIDKNVQKILSRLKRGFETYNDVIRRLIESRVDVYVEFVLIDNELPQTHTAVFQMGEDSQSVYFFNGSDIQPITIEKTQELLKQPKPNMTITREEARILYGHFDYPTDTKEEKIAERIEKFLEQN